MSNLLHYKGYYGSVEFSAEDNVLHGMLLGIESTITYEGKGVKSLRKDFELAVEDYLAMCEEEGHEPEKPYKGSFNVRIDPALHKQIALYSASEGRSMNSVVEEAIRNYVK